MVLTPYRGQARVSDLHPYAISGWERYKVHLKKGIEMSLFGHSSLVSILDSILGIHCRGGGLAGVGRRC